MLAFTASSAAVMVARARVTSASPAGPAVMSLTAQVVPMVGPDRAVSCGASASPPRRIHSTAKSANTNTAGRPKRRSSQIRYSRGSSGGSGRGRGTYTPKSSSMMFSGSTPRLSSMLMHAWFIIGGPHM